MKRFILYPVLLLTVGLFMACGSDSQLPTESNSISDSESTSLAKRSFMQEYEVTFENLTPATGPGASQPFAPPVFATHMAGYHVFQMRRYASTELAQLAEDAVGDPLIQKLMNAQLVREVGNGNGVIFPGSSEKFYIKSLKGFNRFSLVSMLVNTNDAFAGADAVMLPRNGSVEYYLYAYDAGSEKNTEMTAHIPGPCCGNPLVRVPTHERIRKHRGILGVGDLNVNTYGWKGPAAKLTIKVMAN